MWVPDKSMPALDVSMLSDNPALCSDARAKIANENKEQAEKLQKIMQLINEHKDLVRIHQKGEDADTIHGEEVAFFALDAGVGVRTKLPRVARCSSFALGGSPGVPPA